MPLHDLGNPPPASGRQARPFSPAVRAGDFVYVSGHVPADALDDRSAVMLDAKVEIDVVAYKPVGG